MMFTRLILVVMFIVGLCMIIVELVKESHRCNPTKVVYRYIPRSFNQQYDGEVPVSEIFHKMFQQPSPWLSGRGEYDRRKQERVNKELNSDSGPLAYPEFIDQDFNGYGTSQE